MTRLFVYGTLVRGERNHVLLERGGARFIAEAKTARRYTLIDLGAFPALIAAGTTAVFGEIFDVDERLLARVDRLEGHPDFYRRGNVELTSGKHEDTCAYFLPVELYGDRPVIESGRWRPPVSHRGRK